MSTKNLILFLKHKGLTNYNKKMWKVTQLIDNKKQINILTWQKGIDTITKKRKRGV